MGHDMKKEQLREELTDMMEDAASMPLFLGELAAKISSHACSEDDVRDIAAWLDNHKWDIAEDLG